MFQTMSTARDYVFTEDAYTTFKTIDESLIETFWKEFDSNRFISKGEVIYDFMICLVLGIEPKPRKCSKSRDPSHAFDGISYVWWRGSRYLIPYDIETAENTFSCYEAEGIRNYGNGWWKKYNQVFDYIKTHVTSRS